MEDKINFLKPTNKRKLTLIFRLLIFFFNYSFISNTIVSKTLYVKTNGKFNNVSNVIFDYANDIYIIEVKITQGDNIIVNIGGENINNIKVGLVLKIHEENRFYVYNDENFTVVQYFSNIFPWN